MTGHGVEDLLHLGEELGTAVLAPQADRALKVQRDKRLAQLVKHRLGQGPIDRVIVQLSVDANRLFSVLALDGGLKSLIQRLLRLLQQRFGVAVLVPG
jgi:hypothetical protein